MSEWQLIVESERHPILEQVITYPVLITPDGRRYKLEELVSINDVMPCPEAAAEWGVSEDKIKRYSREGKFLSHECRLPKAGRPWLVTRQGMTRVFGELK